MSVIGFGDENLPVLHVSTDPWTKRVMIEVAFGDKASFMFELDGDEAGRLAFVLAEAVADLKRDDSDEPID
jgi:hypothetical protein